VPRFSSIQCSSIPNLCHAVFLSNLLLKHDAVDTRFQQRKYQACLPLKTAQRVEYFGRRIGGKFGNDVGELSSIVNQSCHEKNLDM
jgi:hypothetical protein